VANVETDDKAVVSLKDGTTRIGPWKDGKPVGDWWTDHQSVAAAPQTSRRAGNTPKKRKWQSDARSASRQKKKRAAARKRAPNVGANDTKPAVVSPGKSRGERSTAQFSPAQDESSSLASEVYGEEAAGSTKDEEEQTFVSGEDSENHRLEEITEWLSGVIGYNPNRQEMKEHAKKFMELGLHSSQMIVDLLPANRVESFSWMKEFHRFQVLSNANLRR